MLKALLNKQLRLLMCGKQ